MEISSFRSVDAEECAEVYFEAVQLGTAHIYDQAQRDGWCRVCPTSAMYRERLDGLTTFVARQKGGITGFMSFREDDGYLDLAFVRPDYAGQGVAYALYCAVLNRALFVGLRHMTVVASEPSYRFFLRQGWRVTGRKVFKEGAAMINTWLMDFDVVPVNDGRHD
jgi:GNAT superfamily N-acetyltransferase